MHLLTLHIHICILVHATNFVTSMTLVFSLVLFKFWTANHKSTVIVTGKEVKTLPPIVAVSNISTQVFVLLVHLFPISFAILVEVPSNGRFWVTSCLAPQLDYSTLFYLKHILIRYVADTWRNQCCEDKIICMKLQKNLENI